MTINEMYNKGKVKQMKRDGSKMQIDILIDELTDCLVKRENNTIVKTEYKKLKEPIKKSAFKSWKFDWSKTQKEGYDIYELFVKGSSEVQGRISLKIDGGVADVDIVESNPYNVGKQGRYIGVGGHLFAIACQCSLEAGCDGYVVFTSKTNLVMHYKEKLNAQIIKGNRMYIDENAARILINQYIER